MIMKEVTTSATQSGRRIGVAEAKTRFSEVLRDTAKEPTIIHSRGRDLAVLLAIDEYKRLIAGNPGGPGTGAAFLGRIDVVKRRHGGGVDDFRPAPMSLRALDPFSRHALPKR